MKVAAAVIEHHPAFGDTTRAPTISTKRFEPIAPKRFPTLVLRPTACVTYSKMLVVTGGWLSMWSGASFQNTTHSSTGTRAALLILADYPTSVLSPSPPPRSLSLASCGDHHRHTVDPHQLTTNLSLQL